MVTRESEIILVFMVTERCFYGNEGKGTLGFCSNEKRCFYGNEDSEPSVSIVTEKDVSMETRIVNTF